MERFVAFAAAVLVAGCPRTVKPPIEPGPVSVAPAISPTPWWASGDAVCPTLEAPPVPGAPPGATTYPGRIVGSADAPMHDIHCDAGGVAHGPATRFHADGKTPAESGSFDRNVKNGVWTGWHGNGRLAWQRTLSNGKPTGGAWRTWYESGTPAERGWLKNDRRHGVWLLWTDGRGEHAEPDRWVEYDDKGGEKSRGVNYHGQLHETLPLCILGMRYPMCRVILIGEFGVRDSLSGDTAEGTNTGEATFELGGILNLDDRHGIGISGGWIFDATYPGTVVKGRYRLWFHDYLALEGSGGILNKRGNEPGVGGQGLTGDIAFVLADTLVAHVTIERYADSETRTLFGLKLGLPGILTAAYVAAHIGAR
jgi:antitoxin component YwqK of YwqJK toxin-antitoxin module